MRSLFSRSLSIHFPLILTLAFLPTSLSSAIWAADSESRGESWPQWRGAKQNGVASGQSFPKVWNEQDGVVWKIELPGRGGSTPVVDGETAYITAGVDGQNTLMAIDLENGKIKWQVDLGTDRGNKHKKGSGSNPSPVIDNGKVYAYFRSGDIACVDASGDIAWQINLQDRYGEDTLWWDLGSSPTVTSKSIVVAVMQTGPSYLVALDKENGDEIWKADRMLGAPEEAAQSYSTPLVVEVDGEECLAVMGADHLTINRVSDGKEMGRLGGFNPTGERFFRSISSPVADGEMVVCPYARGATLTAVNMNDLVADKGQDSIAWFRDDIGSDVPTPAALENRVYVVGDGRGESRGLISCLDLQTGKTIWSLNLPRSRRSYSSSPLVAGNHLYVTNEIGTTFVLGPLTGNQPELISENAIDDNDEFTVASLVPVGDDLLLRSRHNLYRISSK